MTEQIIPPPLNTGQKAAADGFFAFLLSDDKEFTLSGAAGFGKTFLMGKLIDEIIPRYHRSCELLGMPPVFTNVVMTATTNKAADVLSEATGRPTQTVHSFFNLKVKEDFSSGKTTITPTNNWQVHENLIIFVDEAFTIDKTLLKYIHEGTKNCKIVYVGDKDQLPPVMEQVSPISTRQMPLFELVEPVRNAGQPALLDICNQLRTTVNTGEFLPIKISPSVIDFVDQQQMQDEIHHHFLNNKTNSKILAYTNKRVIQYNQYVRGLRNLPAEFTEGEVLVLNNPVNTQYRTLAVEEIVTIERLSPHSTKLELPYDVELEVKEATLSDKHGVMHHGIKIPVNMKHYYELIKFYARQKDWVAYFKLKNKIPDLREIDGTTVHKSQGSTYDTVFIDMANLSECRNPTLAARLLYVSFSRAKSRVVMYGELAGKFGGIIYD